MAPRLLLEDGEATGLVVGRGLLSIAAAVARGVVLPPASRATSLSATARHRAARQQVLAAVDLGRFAEDGGAAVAHQPVHAAPSAGLALMPSSRPEPPHCRPTVMWLAGTGWRCTRLASSSIHSTSSMPLATVFFGAAAVLDAEGLQLRAFVQAFLRAGRRSGWSRSPGPPSARRRSWHARIAAQRAAQDLQWLAVAAGGAAGAVRQRHHAVDVRERLQRRGLTSRRKWSAMARAAVAEQFTEVSTPR